MSLRDIAEQDLSTILEDHVTGFGWAITVTDAAGLSVPLTGFSNDVSQAVDPETGQLVSGRIATVTLRIGLLTANGLALPVGVADPTIKPWLMTFDDINGNSYTFKVSQSNPDRALGLVFCVLETYEP